MSRLAINTASLASVGAFIWMMISVAHLVV
jgi:hypothetical protein